MPHARKRFLLAFLGLLALFLNALQGYDFSHCEGYYKRASHSGSVSLFWKGGQVSFAHGKLPKGAKILKADPFIGFYLLKTPPTEFAYNLLDIDERAYTHPLASISTDRATPGRIVKRQEGFLDFAKFSTPVAANGVVSNICYQIYGVGVGGGFIEARYIKRFLRQKSPYYGDIGVRVRQRGGVVVESIDPFFPNNPFLEQDKITNINGRNINNVREFEWVVSNLAYQERASVQVLRGGRLRALQVRVDKRYGGFLLPDSFLERFGIRLSPHFVIQTINKSRPHDFKLLHVGDKLVWINRRPIAPAGVSFSAKLAALRRALSHAYMQGRIEMLVLRNGFEFYVRL
ncbi:PDZ domain-containing protein [Helicobacter sp. NHP19-012]|uniref:PDZ domain-containing protein n=1 Tax=Helicobacter gastrofelis TaxID=2849642 RepID=A0ABM7SLR3_9HELI|nr:PDZ domain-containing protein [Helicobacter sp. NHP19-012]BCZ18564.1 PDZ domain-containing protein [Helicobacter sp. NHP19-012]